MADMVGSVVDRAVMAVAPNASKRPLVSTGHESVHWWVIMLVCLPMIYATESFLEVRTTLLLLVNIWLRLMYPTSYFPACAVRRGFVSSPMTARCVAFVAEYSMYEVWARWAGVDYWCGFYNVWLMVFIGEVVSTLGVILQSEALLSLEDSIWTLHALYMAYFSLDGKLLQLLFFGGFGGYMLAVHLPRRFGLWLSRGSPFTMNPLFSTGSVAIRMCEFEEKAWVVPMLLGQPLLMTLMYQN